jgi:hypothetical protein
VVEARTRFGLKELIYQIATTLHGYQCLLWTIDGGGGRGLHIFVNSIFSRSSIVQRIATALSTFMMHTTPNSFASPLPSDT